MSADPDSSDSLEDGEEPRSVPISGFVPAAKLPPKDPRAAAFPAPKKPLPSPKAPDAAKLSDEDREQETEPPPEPISEEDTAELSNVEALVLPDDSDEQSLDSADLQELPPEPEATTEPPPAAAADAEAPSGDVEIEIEPAPEPVNRGRATGSIPPPMSLERGPIARFGRFDILGRLAVGGMADLLLARETVEGGASRNTVIKLIRGEYSEDSAFAQMFLDEGRLAMRLSHPAICTVYECGRESGRFFMAMEHVEGQTLQKSIARSVTRQELMPLGFLLRVFAQVAEALDFAHNVRDAQGRRLNIVHRDVSPNNIMIRYDGVVKLLDFGVAKAERNQADTVSGAVKGKFSYMSPEQAMSEPVDPRSDIFSLGVCLFEAATGRRLYKRKAQYEVLKAILKEPAPSVLSVRDDLPESLDEIILKCLEKDPADRYQTAEELQHDLESLIPEVGAPVTTRTVAQRMQAMFAEERAAGPELDRSHAVVERFEALMSEAPPAIEAIGGAGSARLAWVVAALALLGLGGVGMWAATRGPDPVPTPPPAAVNAPEPPPPAPEPAVPDPPEPEPAVAPVVETGAETVDSAADPVVAGDPSTPGGETTSGDEEPSPTTTRRRRRGRRNRRGARRGGGSVIVTNPGF